MVEEETPVRRFELAIAAIQRDLELTPGHWYGIIRIGWWQLLMESPPGMRIDAVLEAGFSPSDWELSIVRCAWDLAEIVAGRSGESQADLVEEDFEVLSSLGLGDVIQTILSTDSDPNACEKVVLTLGWKEAVAEFDPLPIKSLGYFWFCDFVRQNLIREQVTTETEAVFAGLVLDSLSALLNESAPQLINGALSLDRTVPESARGWIPGFVTFPFGV